MGLFNFIKGQFIDVIEWVDNSRDTIIYKFPDDDKEVKMGAQLTVRESQAGIFINEGKMADIFEPGRYELTTRNMPILTSLKSWKYGFNSPFKVDIYFINTRQFTNLKWGTPSPVTVPDSKFGQVEFRAFGSYNFKIIDPGKFFTEFAGTDEKVTIEELEGTLRGKLIDKFTEIVAEMAEEGLSFVQFQAKKSEFTKELWPRLDEYFAEFGIKIKDFSIQSITLPPELQEFLRKNTQMNMVGDLNKFNQFQMSVSMEKSAESGKSITNPQTDMTSMMMQQMMMQQMNNMNMNNMNQNNQVNQNVQNNDNDEMSKDEIMKTLKDLGDLKAAGILTEDEFNAKKADLLAKL